MAPRVNPGVSVGFMSVTHSENLLMCYNMNNKLHSNNRINSGGIKPS